MIYQPVSKWVTTCFRVWTWTLSAWDAGFQSWISVKPFKTHFTVRPACKVTTVQAFSSNRMTSFCMTIALARLKQSQCAVKFRILWFCIRILDNLESSRNQADKGCSDVHRLFHCKYTVHLFDGKRDPVTPNYCNYMLEWETISFK